MSTIFDVVEARKETKRQLPIYALSLGAFAVGTSEFMISGLLRTVAADLDISIATAGYLITGYALGVAFGGPVMAVLTGRLDRRTTLLALLAIFALGNLLSANAPTYHVLLAGRVVTSFCHGAFYGLASVVGGTLVPPERRARAVALISAGVMIANVVGVPAGTALGQTFGWRTAFWVVASMGAAAAAALVVFVPSLAGAAESRLLSEIQALARPKVLVGLGLCFLFTLGFFGLFTYLTPMLVNESGANPGQVPIVLLLFGLGSTAGVLGGGRLGDWNLIRALALAFEAQVIAYSAILVLGDSLGAMCVLVFALGVCAMAAVAPLKTLVLSAAFDAPVLASTLSSSALNLGVASGAAVGAIVLDGGFGYGALPWIGIVGSALALAAVKGAPCFR